MKRWFKAVAAGALSLAPLAAIAAIDTTHHDMSATGAGVSTQKCAYCHSISLPSAATGANYYGLVGTFCAVVCHDGTGGLASAVPNRPGYFDINFARQGVANDVSTVAFSASHGELVSLLPIMDATGGDRVATVGATGWPHSAQAELECTTCHAVHDGTNPPFLNGPLSTQDSVNGTSFCQRCHTGSNPQTNEAGRFEVITAMGAHPSEFPYATAPVRAAPKLPREMDIKANALMTNTTVATVAGFNAWGVHWDTGGKFIAGSGDALPVVAAADATLVGGFFGCYSCHSAHQAQTAATETNSTNLLMARMNDSAGAPDGTSVLCTGCHGLATSTQNPGTAAGYHPANAGAAAPYEHNHTIHGAVAGDGSIPATGTFPIPILGDTTGAALAALATAPYIGQANNVMCVTCHDVHGGVPGQMALRNLDPAIQLPPTSDSICTVCHKASTDNAGLTSNFHHRGNTATDYTAAAVGGFPAAAAWATSENLGNMVDGLSCVDCHVFQSTDVAPGHRATAHNW